MFEALSTQERNIHWGDNPLVVVAEIINSNEKAAIKLKKEVVVSLLLFSNGKGRGQSFYKPNKPDCNGEYLQLDITLYKENKNSFHDLLKLWSDDGGQTFWIKYADCATFYTQIYPSNYDIPNPISHAYDVYTIGVEQS